MMQKVLIKVYFENEFVGLEVFTDEKKFLRYVENMNILMENEITLYKIQINLHCLGAKFSLKKY